MSERARLTDRIAWRREGDGVLVYDVHFDFIRRGNAQARLVLEACEAGLPVRQVAALLDARYGLGEARALRDVNGFLNGLVTSGLAEWADGAA